MAAITRRITSLFVDVRGEYGYLKLLRDLNITAKLKTLTNLKYDGY